LFRSPPSVGMPSNLGLFCGQGNQLKKARVAYLLAPSPIARFAGEGHADEGKEAREQISFHE
jgi:hypothetical protein